MALQKLSPDDQLTPLQKLALGMGGGSDSPPPAPAPASAPTVDPATAAGITQQASQTGYTTPGFSTDANGDRIGLDGTTAGNPVAGLVAGLIGNEGGATPAPSSVPAGAVGTEPAGTTTAPDAPVDNPPDATPTGAADLSTDPVYQAQKAEDDRLLNQAASGYLASTKDLLLGYGSQELAKQTLDQLLKDPKIAAIFTPADEAAFLSAISANPDSSMSTLARIARSQRERASQADESMNQANLFYSGPRAKALGDQAYGFQGESQDARGKVMDALSRIGGDYNAAANAARSGDLAGFQSAYERALQEALQYGTGSDPTDKTSGSTGAADTGGKGNTSTTSQVKTTTPKTASAKSAGAAKGVKVARAPQLISEHGLGQMKRTPKVKKKGRR